RVIARHPRDEFQQATGTMHLLSDGAHVFARTHGKLAMVDPADGTEKWSLTWPYTPIPVGSDQGEDRGPWVAVGGNRVAIAFPDRVQVHDVLTGAKVGAAPLVGEAPTGVVVVGGVVVVAVERAP